MPSKSPRLFREGVRVRAATVASSTGHRSRATVRPAGRCSSLAFDGDF